MLADALSTSLFIMGYDGAVTYWKSHGDAFDMVLVTDRGEITVTEGISNRFSTGEEVTVVNR
jgi:thiamine biosynthesis lipoprotein ApbE